MRKRILNKNSGSFSVPIGYKTVASRMLAPPSPARAAGCGRVQVGGERSAVTPGAAQGLLPPAGCQRRRAEGSVVRGSVRLPAAGARAVLFLIGNPPLPRGQHVIEGVPADTGLDGFDPLVLLLGAGR